MNLHRSTRPAPIAALMLFALAAACKSGPAGPRAAVGTGWTPDGGVLSDGTVHEIVDINILHTSDEHGWLEPAVPPGCDAMQGGAANLYSWLVKFEGYDPERFLLLSSGDNWTGPALSTWFAGEPMVETFNLMEYDAVAIGNHEFDFGRLTMLERFAQSNAPYLAANIRDIETGQPAGFALPYVIVEVNAVRVGVIGLANAATSTCTHPLSTLDLEFGGYAETLDRYVPEVRAKGAEVVVVLAHACQHELRKTAEALNARVEALFGAHCHKLFIDEVASIPLMGSGWAFRAYGRLTLRYNRRSRQVEGYEARHTMVEYPQHRSNPVEPDPLLSDLVARWRDRNDRIFKRKIGFLKNGFVKNSWTMANWVADSWLDAFPDVDASILLFGGFRQFVPSGSVTVSDIASVLPFENELMKIRLTGARLIEFLAQGARSCTALRGCYPAVGAVRYRVEPDTVRVEFFDGRPVEPVQVYTVLVTDFLYFGGGGYPLQDHDPHGRPTGVNYREPVIRWTERLHTSRSDPLENHIDPTPRDR